MMENGKKGILQKADYVEPRCPLSGTPYGMTPEIKPVPQQRIVEKLDEYMGKKDFAGAERHLRYWLEEAQLGKDLRGELSIRNEQIGFYRKRGRKEAAYESISAATELLDALDFAGTISAGTTYTNAATACYTFGDYEASLSWFEKAKPIYEGSSHTDPSLLGGLWNNMALTYIALERYDEALALYEKAMEIMEHVEGGALEQAITCLNIANAKEAQLGMEEAEKDIAVLLDRAEALLDGTEALALPGGCVLPGYYAFVLESCAPTFSYYGYFLTAEKLNERARKIYEGA